MIVRLFEVHRPRDLRMHSRPTQLLRPSLLPDRRLHQRRPRQKQPDPSVINTVSVITGRYAPPATHIPIIAVICGTPSELITALLRNTRPKSSVSGNTSSCSGRNTPAESTRYSVGIRFSSAIVCARSTFFAVIGKNAPAFTVASFATIMHSRPLTLPNPVTTPAAGAPPYSPYIPYAAQSPNSRNSVPSDPATKPAVPAPSAAPWPAATPPPSPHRPAESHSPQSRNAAINTLNAADSHQIAPPSHPPSTPTHSPTSILHHPSFKNVSA